MRGRRPSRREGPVPGTASWVIPGRASNSARIPITGLPDPHSAMKAVGIPATPASTEKPAARSSCWSRAELSYSWYPTSASSQISMATWPSRSCRASMRERTEGPTSWATRALPQDGVPRVRDAAMKKVNTRDMSAPAKSRVGSEGRSRCR